MTEHRFKTRLGLFIIVVNLVMILAVFGCFIKGWFDGDQFTTVLAIVVPMFACYATAAVRYVIGKRVVRRRDDSKRRVGGAMIALSFGMPSLLGIFILGLIGAQVDGRYFKNFAQFKTFLFLAEGVFSANIGAIMYRVFGSASNPPGDLDA